MSFVDEATIDVKAGDGGDGIVNFRREAHVPRGGPDGGDGGKGGNVYALGVRNRTTLYDYRFKRVFEADCGERGEGSRRSGKSGGHLELEFPLGTILTERSSGALVADLVEDGVPILIAEGGKGGLGNVHFKSSRRRSPEKATKGKPGQALTLEIELKLIADVGLIGLPNAGKSTLLRVVSGSRAQVGAWPFTTLSPNLGVVRHREAEFVIADIPGLIEGASEGRGLGIRFLKHVQRAGLLLHLVSMEELDNAMKSRNTIVEEMRRFDEDLPLRESAVVLTKADIYGGVEADEVSLVAEEFTEAGLKVFPISAPTGEGVDDLLNYLIQALQVD
jgi:GTPase